MKEAAEEAERAGVEAHEGLIGDPERRVVSWFSRVYRRGYMHGFFRALAYATHHAKEGRLRRIRSLWDEASHRTEERYAFPVDAETAAERVHLVALTPKAYNEITQLLNLRSGVRLDATSSQDVNSPG